MSFEKISNAVWTAVGLGIGVLALLGLLTAVVSGGMAFYKYKIHKVHGVTVKDNGETSKDGLKLTVQYGLPLPIASSDFFMVPVRLEKKEGEKDRHSSFEASSRKSSSYDSGGSSEYAADLYTRFWGPYYNLIFVNKKTGESRTLLEEKGFIREVYFPGIKYGEKEAETKPAFILYKIAFTDTNRDGLINEKDALGGYVSAPDGTKLVRITPEDAQMNWWGFDKETQTLFLESLQDANHDREFDREDPKTLLKVNVLEPKTGREVIGGEIKEKVSRILNVE